jgi:hypothetical protein
MGQPVTVVQKPTSRADVVRFEINRAITGMDPHRYIAGQEVEGHRPPDELARRLLARPGVEGVHVFGNVITVDLGAGVVVGDELADEIASLFTYYREGVEPAGPDA